MHRLRIGGYEDFFFSNGEDAVKAYDVMLKSSQLQDHKFEKTKWVLGIPEITLRTLTEDEYGYYFAAVGRMHQRFQQGQADLWGSQSNPVPEVQQPSSSIGGSDGPIHTGSDPSGVGEDRPGAPPGGTDGVTKDECLAEIADCETASGGEVHLSGKETLDA